MRYVTRKNNSLYYQRQYPTRVATKAPSKFFSMVLDAKADATEAEIAKAAAVATEAFEIEIRRLDNSDRKTASDEAIEALATKALRKLGLKDLDMTSLRLKPVIPEGDPTTPEELIEHVVSAWLEKELSKLPESDEIEQAVKARVAERLTKRNSQTPKRLSQLWKPYCLFRDVEQDESIKQYRKKLSNWTRALSYIGDHPLVDSTDKEINRGHRELVNELIESGVKPESATRAITMSLGCFRWAADEYDLNWNIKAVRVTARAKSTPRKTASRAQMVELAKQCIEWDDVQAVVALLGLHGMIPTEIARIESTKTLDSEIPHILLPEGKTAERKRAVVICFGLDVLKRHLDDAIAYCIEKGEKEGGSATLNKRMRGMFPDESVTLYSLRHGCRNAYVMSGASTPMMNAALGWAGAEGGGMHLHYGAEGIDQSEFLDALRVTGERAHKPIIEALA